MFLRVTAQASDSVTYAGSVYQLAGVTGEGLFDPFAHGLDLVATTTANWRGYVAHYAVVGDRFVLEGLTDVGIRGAIDEDAMRELAPDLAGAAATWKPGVVYEDIDLPIAFTGRLLLGRGFLRDLYVHMGFHPAWKFEHVWELVLADGMVQEAQDISEQAAQARREILEGAREDPDGPPAAPDGSRGRSAWVTGAAWGSDDVLPRRRAGPPRPLSSSAGCRPSRGHSLPP